ncbi:MAG TPA: zinc ribbon domain-containing protein [Polyangiaceae bacterium]|nr:zinc ribbon domain-containing protein [Polyangiaceae bacterium]
MPVYEYECGDHGVFELLRSIAERAEPAPCPSCAREAPRVVSVPHLSGMARPNMIAHARNERSRHEPRHVHAGHTHARAPAQAIPERRPALQRSTGSRPWVLEHG